MIKPSVFDSSPIFPESDKEDSRKENRQSQGLSDRRVPRGLSGQYPEQVILNC
jgi:hypothetical protein